MENHIDIRPLASPEEFLAFEALQRETWGQDLAEVVSGSLAKIVQRIGGIVAGAFDEREHLLGFVFGFTGFREGRPVHWSHMLAVKKEYRNSGIGKSLKLYQREALLAAGVEEVFWTYDPIVAKNAYFNFVTLGAEATQYVPDMYGPGDDSELFRGLGTDRFIVIWRLASDQVKKALAQNEPSYSSSFSQSPIAVFRKHESEDASPPSEVHFKLEENIRIEIPADIHALRERSAGAASQWRTMTREAFQFYLKNGYEIPSFYVDRPSGRCFYCLMKKG